MPSRRCSWAARKLTRGPGKRCLSLRDGFELLRVTRNAPLVASILVGRLVPSLRWRLEIQSAFTAAFAGETHQLRAINPALWRNWSVNGGANVAPASPPFDGKVTAQVQRKLYTELFYVDPANAKAIDQILELAASRKIPIFWVLFPLSPELQSLRDQSGADVQHDRFLKSIVAASSRNGHRARRPPSGFSCRVSSPMPLT